MPHFSNFPTPCGLLILLTSPTLTTWKTLYIMLYSTLFVITWVISYPIIDNALNLIRMCCNWQLLLVSHHVGKFIIRYYI